MRRRSSLALALLLARIRSHENPAEARNRRLPMPFIVGAPRSGTTLLRLMLDAHPDLAIPPETAFILSVLKIWAATPDGLRHKFHAMLTSSAPESAWPDFNISAGVFLKALKAIEPFSLAEGLRCFYRMYAARFAKPRWGDKTPAYGPYICAIERLLPEAHFIHIIRDGRDAALSLRDLWFSPGRRMAVLARSWRDHVATTRAQGRRCRRYLEIRYEDLVLDPRRLLKDVCSFVGLDYDPRMESYYIAAPERLKEHKARRNADGSVIVSQHERLHQQRLVTQPPDPSRVHNWRTAMESSDQREFERVAAPLLAELGYELRR